MLTLVGYIAYALICAFNPLQLWLMVRGKNIDLGAWPLVSLTAGLALLLGTFAFVTVPLYVVIGTAVSMVGCAANLSLILNLPSRVAALVYRPSIDGRRPAPKNENVFMVRDARDKDVCDGCHDLREELVKCDDCGCVTFQRDAQRVDTRVVGDPIYAYVGNPHGRFDRHDIAYQWYCGRDTKPYDIVDVYFGQPGAEGCRVFYKRATTQTAPFASVRSPDEQQVTEDGELFD